MGHYLWALKVQDGNRLPLLGSLHCGEPAAGWQTLLGHSYPQLAIRVGCCLRAQQEGKRIYYPSIPKSGTRLAQRDNMTGNSCGMSVGVATMQGSLKEYGFDPRGQ